MVIEIICFFDDITLLGWEDGQVMEGYWGKQGEIETEET